MSFPFPIAGGYHYPPPTVIPNTGVKPGFYGTPDLQIAADGRIMNATGSTTMVNVKAFGAKSDGRTDDTAAVQAAMNTLANTGVILIFSGTTMLSSTVTCSGVVNMLGGGGGSQLGDGQSRIIQTNVNAGHFLFSNVNGGGIWIQNLVFAYTSLATFTVPSVRFEATGSTWTPAIQNCTWFNCGIGLDFVTVTQFTVTSCFFFGTGNGANSGCIGIKIQNTLNTDGGDSTIQASFFEWGIQYGVYHLNAGGMRFMGNKINGAGWGYYIALNAPTSDFTFICNSWENQALGGIFVGGTGIVNFNVIIVANQFSPGALSGTSTAKCIFFDSGITSCTLVSIVANVFAFTGTGPIITLRNVFNYTVTGNAFLNNGSPVVGLDVDSSCNYGYIQPIDTLFPNITVSIDDTATNYYQSSSGTARNHLIPISTTSGVTNLASLTASGVITLPSVYTATPGPTPRYVKVGTDNILASAATLMDDPVIQQLISRLQSLEDHTGMTAKRTKTSAAGWFS